MYWEVAHFFENGGRVAHFSRKSAFRAGKTSRIRTEWLYTRRPAKETGKQDEIAVVAATSLSDKSNQPLGRKHPVQRYGASGSPVEYQ